VAPPLLLPPPPPPPDPEEEEESGTRDVDGEREVERVEVRDEAVRGATQSKIAIQANNAKVTK
jgi:hypothetical protein